MAIDANTYPNSGGLILNQFLGVFANTESESDSTGALQVWGGAAIKKNLYVAGNLTIANAAAFTGNISTNGNLSILGNIFSANVTTGQITATKILVGNVIATTANVTRVTAANVTAANGIVASDLILTNINYEGRGAVTRSEMYATTIVFGF